MLPGSNPGWLGRKGEHFLCAQLSPFLTWARILHNDTYASLTEKEETESRNMLQILPPKKIDFFKKMRSCCWDLHQGWKIIFCLELDFLDLTLENGKKERKVKDSWKLSEADSSLFSLQIKSHRMGKLLNYIFTSLMSPPPLGIGWVPLKCSNISGCSTVVKHHSASQNTTRSWVPTSIG